MNIDMILGLVRHLLTFGGGHLVAKGLVDESTMLEIVAAVITVIGGDPLQPADRNRFLVDAPATAGRLTGPVANSAEYAREHVRLAVLDVSVAKPPLRDQPYI